MEFFKLKTRELNLFILCCIIIIVAVSYVFLIEPSLKHYTAIRKEIKQKQANFLKLRQVFLLKDSIEAFYEEISPRFSQVGSDEERFALFLKEIELLSRHNDIYITTLKPISVLSEGNYKEYLIRMEAEGKMEALAKFLYNLPQSTQIINLKQLQINYLSREEAYLQFKMNLGRMIVEEE